MRSECRDTRDAATRPRVRIAVRQATLGEFAELRVFLEDVLGIPKHARRFSVTFADGQAPVVSVEYMPRETLPEES